MKLLSYIIYIYIYLQPFRILVRRQHSDNLKKRSRCTLRLLALISSDTDLLPFVHDELRAEYCTSLPLCRWNTVKYVPLKEPIRDLKFHPERKCKELLNIFTIVFDTKL